MKKIIFLMSHIPNPRMTKRINLELNNSKKYLIYQNNNNACDNYTINCDVEQNTIDMKLKNKIGNFPYFLKKALKILININPDFIYLGNMDMLFIGVIYKKYYNTEVKIFYEIADLTDTYKKSIIKSILLKIGRKLEQRFLKKYIDKLILTSDYFWKNYYVNFLNEIKYLFIPNCPTKKIFKNIEKIESDYFRIGFVGNVRYEKVFYELIDSLAELKNRKIQLIISGRGKRLKEITYYAELKGINFKLTGEYNYEKDIKSIYENLDCVYSLYDSNSPNVKIALPNKLYESIVSKVPIIVSKDTYVGEIVKKLKIGIACDLNKKSIKKAILDLYENKKYYNELVKNCELIKENYYFEQYEEKLKKIFEKI